MLRIFWFFWAAFVTQTVVAGDDIASKCGSNKCVAVVDAGSSGSRLHIYLSKSKPLSAHDIVEVYSRKIEPGISSVETNESVLDAYLGNLFDGVDVSLPVYFYATAGMRLLPAEKQGKIYQIVEQWFSNRDLLQLEQAKTISGQMEGVFGWLAVNWYLERFSNPDEELVGVMDMGGASVQVALPVSNSHPAKSRDIFSFTLYGRQIQIFAHSFLALGQTPVFQQFLDNSACFPQQYPLPGGGDGMGDAIMCKHSLAKLVNGVHDVRRIAGRVIAKNPVKAWYAMGGVSYLAQSPPFLFSHQFFTPDDLLHIAEQQVCQQSWPYLQREYNSPYLFGYCLGAAYYYALMVNGYGLPTEQPLHYISPGESVSDWTLGAALDFFNELHLG